jgi:hypothetical protein
LTPKIQEIYSKEHSIQSGKVYDYLEDEKHRLLKKFNCQTIEEVIIILERKLAEKKKQ